MALCRVIWPGELWEEDKGEHFESFRPRIFSGNHITFDQENTLKGLSTLATPLSAAFERAAGFEAD
ncbi:MAG: hypothetical protein R3C24_15720 [Cyanobacteriota/Melainabacteria group bacterium]